MTPGCGNGFHPLFMLSEPGGGVMVCPCGEVAVMLETEPLGAQAEAEIAALERAWLLPDTPTPTKGAA